MKKSLIALAALGAFAGAASAQSSVTLFGIVDVGARAVENGNQPEYVKSLSPNGLASSRIGFRGIEDLGGGLRGSFWLEASLANDTGTVGTTGVALPTLAGVRAASTSNKFFDRRATVSLIGPFGEVRLGRDFVPTFSNLAAFDVYGAVGGSLGSVLNLISPAPGANNTGIGVAPAGGVGTLGSGAGTLVRADNGISYFLPSNIGGVYGTVMAAAGEGNATTNGHNRYVGGRVGFAAGPVDVAGAYGRTRIEGQADDFEVWNVGAALNFGIGKLAALYHRAQWDPNGPIGQLQQRVWTVGANVPIGQGEIRATYGRSDVSGGTAALIGLRNQDDARQAAIGYIHNLSKRTAVYADVARLENRGGSRLTIAGGNLNGSDFLTAGDRNRDSKAFGIGVRHSF